MGKFCQELDKAGITYHNNQGNRNYFHSLHITATQRYWEYYQQFEELLERHLTITVQISCLSVFLFSICFMSFRGKKEQQQYRCLFFSVAPGLMEKPLIDSVGQKNHMYVLPPQVEVLMNSSGYEQSCLLGLVCMVWLGAGGFEALREGEHWGKWAEASRPWPVHWRRLNVAVMLLGLSWGKTEPDISFL